jgi:GTP-binding protein
LALLVDVTSEDPRHDAEVVEKELRLHSQTLAEKPRVTVLTKADLLPPEQHESKPRETGLEGATLISAHSGEGVQTLLEQLWERIAALSAEEGATHDR